MRFGGSGTWSNPAADYLSVRREKQCTEIGRSRRHCGLRILHGSRMRESFPHDPGPNGRPAPYDSISLRPTIMLRLRQDDLPHTGSSHWFVGADHGDVDMSAFLFHGAPGSGPGPHRHPYDEIQFIQSGRGRWTVEGQTFEAGAGDILVVKAGEVHSFTAIGDEPLVQLDVHLSRTFVQENLRDLPDAASNGASATEVSGN